ncbi:hypothetical protein LguiA_023907 [Lonicera macranthoides]
MPLLTDKSPLEKRKRFFENGECQGCDFPQKSECSKVSSPLRHALAAVDGDKQTKNSIAGTDNASVQVEPSRISVRMEPNSGSKNSSDEPKVSAENVERGVANCGFFNVGENGSDFMENNTLGSVRKLLELRSLCRHYPPPKIRKGISVFRQFPPGCGSEIRVSSSKPKDLRIEKSGVEQRQLAQKNDKQLRDGFCDKGCAFGEKSKAKGEICKDRGEVQSNFNCQMVTNKDDDGATSVTKRSNGNTEAENGTGLVMHSQGAESFDLVPSFGDGVAAKDRGKWLCDPAFSEATHGNKRQKSGFAETVSDGCRRNECILPVKGLIDQSTDNQAVVSRNKVREALNLFEEIYEKLAKENKAKPDKQGKGAWPILVEAAEELRKQRKWVNTDEHFLGAVPGVEVGDRFNFRVELAVIGLHSHYNVGIAYVNIHEKSYATSIVESGRYANKTGSPNKLIYSGQGGNPAVACKKLEDQKLERGNLALKNSMDVRSPVRVIRSCQASKASSPRSPSSEKKAYIYDGLYIVTKCWQERGHYGKLVFMFQLERIKGQPELAPFEPSLIELAPLRVSQSRKSKECNNHCVVDDISQGKEKNPIRALNAIDDEKPPSFNYITDMIYPELNDFSVPRSCDCVEGCSDFEQCSCVVKNGGELPFNGNGAIVKAKPIIYECGPLCKCPPWCKNRVSQRGVQYKLEIFKTESRGWSVRSQSFISAGRFICEYAGEVLRDNKAVKDEYSMDIGTNFHCFQEGSCGFTIDATHFGNVGRFIRHSCTPNLYVQNVLYDHEDERMTRIMLFSAKNIPPLRELTCNFNYKTDQVGNGNIKKDCSGKVLF